jgi:sec-independent protein translocase protein TatA
MDIPGPIELLIIAGVILVLFGSRKLPEAARSMGRSLRIFKSEVRGMHADDQQAALPAPVAHVVEEPQPVTRSVA